MRLLEPKFPKTTKRYISTRAGKTELIGKLGELLRRSQALLRFTYKRFTPNERRVLNRRLRSFLYAGKDGSEPCAKLRMVKNTLMQKAMEGTAWEAFAPRMHGPSMCCFVFDEGRLPQILAAVERLRASDKKIRRHVTLDSASFARRVVEPAELFSIANYASREDVLARLLRALSGGAAGVAGGLRSVTAKLAVALNETASKGGEAKEEGNVAVYVAVGGRRGVASKHLGVVEGVPPASAVDVADVVAGVDLGADVGDDAQNLVVAHVLLDGPRREVGGGEPVHGRCDVVAKELGGAHGSVDGDLVRVLGADRGVLRDGVHVRKDPVDAVVNVGGAGTLTGHAAELLGEPHGHQRLQQLKVDLLLGLLQHARVALDGVPGALAFHVRLEPEALGRDHHGIGGLLAGAVQLVVEALQLDDEVLGERDEGVGDDADVALPLVEILNLLLLRPVGEAVGQINGHVRVDSGGALPTTMEGEAEDVHLVVVVGDFVERIANDVLPVLEEEHLLDFARRLGALLQVRRQVGDGVDQVTEELLGVLLLGGGEPRVAEADGVLEQGRLDGEVLVHWDVVPFVLLNLELGGRLFGFLEAPAHSGSAVGEGLPDVDSEVCQVLREVGVEDQRVLVGRVAVDVAGGGSDGANLHCERENAAGLLVVLYGGALLAVGAAAGVVVLAAAANVPAQRASAALRAHPSDKLSQRLWSAPHRWQAMHLHPLLWLQLALRFSGTIFGSVGAQLRFERNERAGDVEVYRILRVPVELQQLPAEGLEGADVDVEAVGRLLGVRAAQQLYPSHTCERPGGWDRWSTESCALQAASNTGARTKRVCRPVEPYTSAYL
ncbi:50S ribosomal protein L10 [Babesia caballi]|uniref:50S ribosomal protein L10 n=1 Tax=Babesia caballi TaxID=5871 RepID=A0AAV4M1B8_BABCB|nr:50S ribosomal protein L10 [Babesia caballi]